MSNPLLIIKTVNGFAAIEYRGELPAVDLRSLLCFGSLDNSMSYRADGLLSAIKSHFAEPPAAADLKEAA